MNEYEEGCEDRGMGAYWWHEGKYGMVNEKHGGLVSVRDER